jgi:uncharacterized NAD(P)/FAD-binding protein YdhS
MPQTETSSYEIVFVGSGISCAAVLLKLIEKIALLAKESNANKPVNIAVIEKAPNLWTGVPYGDRSSVNSLTITTLGDFVPVAERDEFYQWLKDHQNNWMNDLKDKGGPVAIAWIQRNLSFIKEDRWDEIYLPRFLFGNYLREKVEKKINESEQAGQIFIHIIKGRTIDIKQQEKDAYEIVGLIDNLREFTVYADKVVLCVGSPPMKFLDQSISSRDENYIHDTYSPSLEDNISKMKAVLQSIEDKAKRNVLLLGSNASSLEFLYLVNGDKELKGLLNKIIVLSTSGELPRRITPGRFLKHHFENMEVLKSGKAFKADDLMIAVQNDLELASVAGVNIADAHDALSDLLVELISLLSKEEKEKFHCFSGADFSKLIRRAGAEYRDAASSLEAAGKMMILKGVFTNLLKKSESQKAYQLLYKEVSNGEVKQYPDIFSVVVNCGGFEQLSTSSSSPLIANLIKNGLCEINCTQRGVKVSETFEASERLYVMGPLLGGLFNSKGQLWHVENAKSIFHLSGLLVDEMMEHSFADVVSK